MSYRSSYGSGYSSSSFRRPYTPSYSSSYSPSYSTSSSLSSSSPYSSSLYRPSTYSTFLSTYRRPSFGSTSSYSSKRTNSSEDLHGSTDDKYSTRDSDSGSTGLRKSNFSRSLGNLSRASFDDNDDEDVKDSRLRDKYGSNTDDVDYKEMYENEKSIRLSEQATLIEDLQAQIELRKQIIQIFEQLTPLEEDLDQEKERCNLLEQLQSLRDEHDRLVKQQQQQQSSQKAQPRTGVQNSRSALGSRRF